jgi:uncharacterized protein (DUF488 family)
MKIYTIGFTQKSAETFFETLRRNGIQKLVDIRVNPHGQLSGFARQEDLPYFLGRLADGCAYVHRPELAPTREILKEYRADGDWQRYVARFEALMDARNIPAVLKPEVFSDQACCLLCSEATPERCHRRLVVERLAAHWPDVIIVHL